MNTVHQDSIETYEVFENTLKTCLDSLKTHGDSAVIYLKGDFLNKEEQDVNWELVEEVQMATRGPYLPSNVFSTLNWSNSGETNLRLQLVRI